MHIRIFAAALLLLPCTASAQERSVKMDLTYVWRDTWHMVETPFRGSGEDWRTAGLLVAGGGALLLVDEPVLEWVRAHPESLPLKLVAPFRMGHPAHLEAFGWTKVLLPAAALAYGAGLVFDNDDLRDGGMGCITSNLATTLPRRLVTTVIGRLRPENDRGAFVFELLAPGWDMRSFPGGHASNAMSCASYLNHRFDTGVAEIPIYVLAGGIGAARIVDEQHWTSDTFLGVAYGYAVGKEVAARFTERELRRERQRAAQPGIVFSARIVF